MKLRRRLFSSAAVAAVIALVCALPTLLSSSVFFPSLRDRLSSHLPGNLTVDRCSLQWFGGLSCRNINYSDEGLGLRVQVPLAHTDKGLFTLLVAPQYLGEVSLEQPRLEIVDPSKQVGAGQPDKVLPPATTSGQIPTSWWEQRSVRLQVTGGRILTDTLEGGSSRDLAQNLNLQGEATAGTVKYRLDFDSGQTKGQFRAQGFVNLPLAGQPFFSTLISRQTVEIHSLDIEPIVSLLARRFPQLPRAKGRLNGTCAIDMTGFEDLDIKGELTLEGVELNGGGLGQDHPRFEQATLVFVGKRHPLAGWHLSRLELTSQPLSFSAQGRLDPERVDLQGQGRADLPLLTAGFPHLLAIHQATRVDKGSVQFSFQAKGEPREIDLQADCTTQRLEVTQAAQAYSWEEPLSVHLQALVQPREVQLSALRVKAPFVEVEGSGEPDTFQLQASADLSGLFSELDKLFALPLHAQGKLTLELISKRLENNLINRRGTLAIEDFLLRRQGRILVPSHALSLDAQVKAEPGYLHWLDLSEGELKLEGWPGSLALGLRQAEKKPGGSGKEQSGPCSFAASLDLTRVQKILTGLTGDESPHKIQGQLELQTEGRWWQDRVSLHTLTGKVEHFVVRNTKGLLLEAPLVSLSPEQEPLYLGGLKLRSLQVVQNEILPSPPVPDYCTLSLPSCRLELKHIRFRTPDALADLQVHFTPGQRFPRFRLEGIGGLELLEPWWHQQGWLDPAVSLKGQLRGSFTLEPGNAMRPWSREYAVDVKKMRVQQGEELLFSEPELRLEGKFEPLPQPKLGSRLTAIKVKTSAGSFAGTGVIHDNRFPALVDLRGQMHPSTTGFSQLLKRLLPKGMSIKETKTGTLLLSAPLLFPLPLQQVTLSGELGLQGLHCLGLELPQANLAFDLHRAVLRAQLQAIPQADGVMLQGEWKEEKDGLTLTIPPETKPLEQVPVTPQLARELLAQIVPFGALVTATGQLGLKVSRFSLPLSASKRQPDFKVTLELHQGKPQAVHALKELLETAGIAPASLRFQERELICESWNGAMTCAPLRLGTAAGQIEITGSKRRNGRISYAVKLPVTKSLLEQAGVAAYGQFFATAKIAGTREAPVFKRQEFFSGLAAQITGQLPKPLARTEKKSAALQEAPGQ